ncbi:hypothetical protein [Neptuniibacter sp.]|uniref:hypothetical protein n=1 Tax=Neptuniibacter sp. TaxID=1962643 RepID=UPI002604658F|nr:hypothetical protein [Neptuniibacter sp.]MCP4596745.1 hypothetical protein [Neptuniibacter sp.]
MDIDELTDLHLQHHINAVNFIESGSGPMVIEVEFSRGGDRKRELIKDDEGRIITCKNIKEGYDICLKAGLHEANLVQIIPDDEVCRSEFADYHKEIMPLKF